MSRWAVLVCVVLCVALAAATVPGVSDMGGTSILKITDGTEAGTVNLLDHFVLNRWRPALPPQQRVFEESPLTDGRSLAFRKKGNAVETFDLKLKAGSQDAAARDAQDAFRLLEKAQSYWEDGWQSEPVWIEAKSKEETNVRYAVVVAGEIPELDDVYGGGLFLQRGCRAAMDSITLVAERMHWQDQVPGSSACVQTSGVQKAWGSQATLTRSPAQQADDCYIRAQFCPGTPPPPPFINLAGRIILGYSLGDGTWTDGGVRFPNITIPPGSHIHSAYVDFEAAVADNGDDCILLIKGEDIGNAAIFSTWADFALRDETTAEVEWGFVGRGIEHWIGGNTYDTPDLSPIIQEIVDHSDWASGNALALFFLNNGSDNAAQRQADSFDTAPTAPVLYITYSATDTDFGRAPTCEDEVYVANKHNVAQLTHVFWWDQSAAPAGFSANLIGAVLPVEIMPPLAIQNNDAIYFGINTALDNTGPFCSLVFDIETPTTYAGSLAINWQYWNAGWVNLPVRDNTDDDTGPFSRAGVNSVHWEQPSDWITTTVNLITGYWVRAIAVIPGAGVITPRATQQNRDIYTILRPSADVAAGQVGGDIAALARMLLHNRSDNSLDAAGPDLWANRAIVARRSLDRGEDYSPYINLADEQNPDGVVVFAGGANTAFDDDVEAATGRRVTYTPAGAEAMTQRATVNFVTADIAGQYRGVYHAFVRAQQVGGVAGAIGVRLRGYMAATPVYTSSTERFAYTGAWQLLDFGRLTFPFVGSVAFADELYYPSIWIEASSTGAGPVLRLYELILMPVDEWAADLQDFSGNANRGTVLGSPYPDRESRILDLDSVSVPKDWKKCLIRHSDTGLASFHYQPIMVGPTTLRENAAQRWWFLTTRFHGFDGSAARRCRPWSAHSLQLHKTQRYLALRGDR